MAAASERELAFGLIFRGTILPQGIHGVKGV